MKTRLFILAAALSCAFSTATLAMTKAEHTTQKDTIAGDYKTARDKCGSLKPNAKDICMSEAKGVRMVTKTGLESAYGPSARHTEKVAMAKGDAAYAIAKEECDDSSGNVKAVCKKDVKTAHVKATDEARVVRVNAAAGSVEKSARNMADKGENEANYKSAAARCDVTAWQALQKTLAQQTPKPNSA